MKKNKFISSALLYISGSVFIQGLTFFTLPIFTNILSPEDFGIVATYNFWTALITIFLGIQTAASINNAAVSYGNGSINEYVSSLSIIGLFSGLLLMTIVWIFQKLFVGIFELPIYILLLGIIQCFFLFHFSLLTTKFIVLKKPMKYLVYSIINASLNIILAFGIVLYLTENKYLGRVYASLYASMLLGVVALIVNYKEGKKLFCKKYFIFAISFSAPLILQALSNIVLGRLDQVMLLKMQSSSEAGIYSFSTNIGCIISVLYLACNQAFVPLYYSHLKEGKVEEVKKIDRMYITLFTILFLCFLCIIPELIKIMGSEEFYSAKYTAPIISLGYYLCYLYSFPVNYEFYHKETKAISLGSVGAAVLNILLNYILIPSFSGIGAAIATALSFLGLFTFHYLIATKIIGGFELILKNFLFPGMIAVVGLLLYYLFMPYWFARWGIAMLLGVWILIIVYKEFKGSKTDINRTF